MPPKPLSLPTRAQLPNSTATQTATASATVPALAIPHHPGRVAHFSYAGQAVEQRGWVSSGKLSNGYYMQTPNLDANDSTSEAIFVFTIALTKQSISETRCG